MRINKVLSEIQFNLKAPKNQRNSFGNYNYRSCEDIVEAVKPHLNKHNAILTLSDEIIVVHDRVYVKSTATISIDEESITTCAFAREPEDKKGQDSAQITGATSSYARKYALNGLLAIDDTKDADVTNTHGKDEVKKTLISQEQRKQINEDGGKNKEIILPVLKKFGYSSTADVETKDFDKIIKALKGEK